LAATQTWTDLWADCTERLGSSEEARWIIEAASGRSGSSWLITLTTPAPDSAAERVNEMIVRRLGGEPLQYVVGRWGFRKLNLNVDTRALIPRPETEQVVDAALEAIDGVPNPVVVDLGTGTGAIALSIAREVGDAQVWATDVSIDALALAQSNRHELPDHVADRVHLTAGNWFEALPRELHSRIDLIVSNPPYVATGPNAPAVESQVSEWEPHLALFAGETGLDAIDVICAGAPEWLSESGSLVVELAPDQADLVHRRALEAGFFAVSVGSDLAGRKRWVSASMRTQPQ
jgi:release factor glutamine methyltransferase